jgi:hypothetical protein
MGVDTMRPAFNLEPKYGVTFLTMDSWTKGTGVPPASTVLLWFTDDSRIWGGALGGYYGTTLAGV